MEEGRQYYNSYYDLQPAASGFGGECCGSGVNPLALMALIAGKKILKFL